MMKKTLLVCAAALIAATASTPALADKGGKKKWHDDKWWNGPVYIGPNNIGYGPKGAYAAWTPHTYYDADDETCVVKKVKVWDKYEGDWDWQKKVVCY